MIVIIKKILRVLGIFFLSGILMGISIFITFIVPLIGLALACVAGSTLIVGMYMSDKAIEFDSQKKDSP